MWVEYFTGSSTLSYMYINGGGAYIHPVYKYHNLACLLVKDEWNLVRGAGVSTRLNGNIKTIKLLAENILKEEGLLK